MGRNRHQVHHLDMVEMGEDSGSVFDPWEGTDTRSTTLTWSRWVRIPVQ